MQNSEGPRAGTSTLVECIHLICIYSHSSFGRRLYLQQPRKRYRLVFRHLCQEMEVECEVCQRKQTFPPDEGEDVNDTIAFCFESGSRLCNQCCCTSYSCRACFLKICRRGCPCSKCVAHRCWHRLKQRLSRLQRISDDEWMLIQ